MIHLTLHIIFYQKKSLKHTKYLDQIRPRGQVLICAACSKLSLTHAMFPVMTSPLLQKNAAMENSFSLVSQ